LPKIPGFLQIWVIYVNIVQFYRVNGYIRQNRDEFSLFLKTGQFVRFFLKDM